MSDPARLFIAVYTDEDITSELAPALRDRGFEAESATECGMLGQEDEEQLHYATVRGMAVLTCNAVHYLALAKAYATAGRSHSGIVISTEQYSRRRFGELLRLTLRLLNTLTADEMMNNVVYLQQFKQ